MDRDSLLTENILKVLLRHTQRNQNDKTKELQHINDENQKLASNITLHIHASPMPIIAEGEKPLEHMHLQVEPPAELKIIEMNESSKSEESPEQLPSTDKIKPLELMRSKDEQPAELEIDGKNESLEFTAELPSTIKNKIFGASLENMHLKVEYPADSKTNEMENFLKSEEASVEQSNTDEINSLEHMQLKDEQPAEHMQSKVEQPAEVEPLKDEEPADLKINEMEKSSIAEESPAKSSSTNKIKYLEYMQLKDEKSTELKKHEVDASPKAEESSPESKEKIPEIQTDLTENINKLVNDYKSDFSGSQGWSNNWRQFTSVLPGVIFLFSFGLQFNWCLRDLNEKSGFPKFFKIGAGFETYDNNYTSNYFELHSSQLNIFSLLNLVSWYVGAALGSIIGAIFVSSYKKMTIYLISGLLLISSGKLFHMESDLFVLGGRTLFGFTYGLVQLTVLVHVSDIATKEMRSAILQKIVYVLSLSTLLFFLVTQIPHHKVYNYFKTGSQLMILGSIGLILTPFLTYETVPYLLLHGKESKALNQLTELRSERKPSENTLLNFEELKLTVLEDKMLGSNIFGGGNLRPLFVITNARLLGILLWNVPQTLLVLNHYTIVKFFTNVFYDRFAIYNMFLHTGLGISTTILLSFIGGHRMVYYISVIFSFFMFFTIGIYYTFGYISIVSQIQSITVIIVFAALSVGVNASHWIHSAQAFPILKKTWSIAMITQIEQIVHIILIVAYSCTRQMQIYFWYSMSAALCIIPVLLLFMLPKSTKLSLREGRDKFNKVTERKIRNNEQSTEI